MTRLDRMMVLFLSLWFALLNMEATGEVSKDQAIGIVRDSILQNDTVNIVLYMNPQPLSQDTLIKSRVCSYPNCYLKSWFFLIDDMPPAGWHHPCRYVFVDCSTSAYTIINETSLPHIWSSLGQVIPNSSSPPDTTRRGTIPSSVSSNTHLYAVIICGCVSKACWADVSAIYSTLTTNYGYLDDHIYVLYGDGTAGYGGADLDHDTDDDIDYAATYDNVVNVVFPYLGENLGLDDYLFVYAEPHGSPQDPWSPTSEVQIDLHPYGEVLTDAEMANLLAEIDCKSIIVTIQACYGGGFVQEDDGSCGNLDAPNHILCSASEWSKPSISFIYNGVVDAQYFEYAYHWTSAARWGIPNIRYDPYPFPWEIIADLDIDNQPCALCGKFLGNDDGHISMKEAFDWAFHRDRWNQSGGHYDPYFLASELPQYLEGTDGLGDRLSLGGLIPLLSVTTEYATASNNARRIERDSDGDIHLVFTSGKQFKRVYHSSLSNGTADWALRTLLGDGEYPALSLDQSNPPKPAVCWIATEDEEVVLYYYHPDVSTSPHELYRMSTGALGGSFHPPSMVIDNEDYAHVVLHTVRVGTKKTTHTILYNTFYVNNPNADWQTVDVFYTEGYTPIPMTSPSVGVDLYQRPVIAYTRITWEWDCSVYYAHKFTGTEWTRINLAQGTHPSIKVGGNEVHVVWEYPGSEIYHVWGAIGSNDVNWLSSPTNISESPDHSSRYPTIIEHNHVLWSEEVSPGLSQIYCNHFYFHKKHDVFKWRVPGDINGVNSGVNELFPQACPGQILFGEDATYGERHYVFTVDDGDGKYGVKHIVDTVLVSHLIAVMSGPVADDTTWETGTVVLVVGDLTIEPSVTLEIEPGVTVLVTKEDGEQGGLDVSRTEIIVSGTLIARGEITDGDTGRIEFTSLDTLGAAGDWYGIRFENASVGSLVYCDVECAEKGIESSGDLRIEGCDIRNNVVGIEVDGGSIVARANRIIENDSIGVLTHVGQNINFGDLANADTTDDGANRIYDNGIWDAYNASPGTPLMQGNCWYSCNSNEIDARIYDNDENAGSGTVDFGDFYFWGSIDTDVTWSGLVSVGGDVSVPILKNLTILPGTKVRFAAGLDMEEAGIDPALSELVIEGSFHASGTTGEPILFTSDALECLAGDWHGIALNQPTIGAPRHYGQPEFTLTSVLPDRNRQVKARREENRKTLGSVDLEWLVVEYATQGISYCKRGIENLNYSEVRDCSDIGVRVEGENVFLMMDHTDVKRVPVGISCRYDGKVWVENSEITECSTTGIVFAGPYGLVDQTIVENCGTGIWTEHIYGPSIEYSDIMNNEIGVHSAGSSAPGIQRTKILNNSLYGVYITDDARPDLGQFCGYNDLYGNPFNVWNGTDNQILARYNYWGTTNLDTIAAHIWDHNDDPALGVVVFQPIRSNPGSSGSSGGATSGTEMIPLTFKLFQNSPNPFTRNTTIRYSVPRNEKVSLSVYDASGRCVRTLVNEEKKPGYHNVSFDGRRLGTGVYFTRFIAGDYKEVSKLILVR